MTIQEAMELALSRHRAGKFAEADAVYRQVLSCSPNHADALNLSGVIAWQAGRHDQAVSMISRAIAINPQVAEYFLNLGAALDDLGQYEDAIGAYQRALVLKPRYPRALSNLANTLRKKGHTREAMNACRAALALEPGSAEAYTNLGATVQPLDLHEAINHYRMAITLQPDFVDAHISLGGALMQNGEFDEAVKVCCHATSLQPACPQAHTNLGNALAKSGNVEKATAAFEEAVNLAPDFAPARWNLGLMHLLREDYTAGWPEYEWRLRVNEFRWHAALTQPRWNGEDLAGRRILLHAEQGLGDVIQFIRFVPRVAEKGGKVVVACHGALHRLLRQTPGVEQWAAFEDAIPAHDIQCPLMSLPMVFGTQPSTIPANVPYIRPDPQLSAKWKSRVPNDNRRKVGLVWKGKCRPDPARATSTQALAPLGTVDDLWLCSLQIGDKAKQESGLELADWTDELKDFAETAALMDNLDLIITVDTAVAHLAGAMGKTAWVLLPFLPDWRWMQHRTDSPWYPTMRLFRQQRPGDWTAPVSKIVEALASS